MVCRRGTCEDECDSERVQRPIVTHLVEGSGQMRLEKAAWLRRVLWHARDGGLGGLERGGRRGCEARRVSARCEGREMRWQLEELAGPGPKNQERRTEQIDGEEGGAQPGKESLKKVSWQGWELPA